MNCESRSPLRCESRRKEVVPVRLLFCRMRGVCVEGICARPWVAFLCARVLAHPAACHCTLVGSIGTSRRCSAYLRQIPETSKLRLSDFGRRETLLPQLGQVTSMVSGQSHVPASTVLVPVCPGTGGVRVGGECCVGLALAVNQLRCSSPCSRLLSHVSAV